MLDNVEMKILESDVKQWIEDNPAQFKPNSGINYDCENLKRIRRFADSPVEYLIERIELNKAVLKDYHKLHHTILMAGITGFYAIVISQLSLSILEKWTTDTNNAEFQLLILVYIILSAIFVVLGGLPTLVLKWSGLLRRIRDSEIEIYYLSKLLESRGVQITKTINVPTYIDSGPEKDE